ncbi:MAG: response regulator [Chloroflexota bacterium]
METKKRVLLVDDEPGILRFVTTYLTSANYEVITATNGSEALQSAADNKPDIILLDLLMVPMGGADVLKKLRTFSQVPVIIVTALSISAEQVRQMGANNFIAKPFKPEKLVRKIEATLKRKT